MKADSQNTQDMAAVISSRICHDLVSPVGAIVNGVDLIREIGAGGLDSEFTMISQSADRASNLLQFYRLAFGAAQTESEEVSRQTLLDRATALIATSRVMLDWDGAMGPPLSRQAARLLCQLLLCARSVAGMRAAISVTLPASESFPMTLQVEGDLSNGAEERLQLLTAGGAEVDLSPRTVEFALAAGNAHELGASLKVSLQTGHTVINAVR